VAVPGISVVIVTHNSERHLTSCISHLSLALSDSDYEVIVVDNASARPPTEVDLLPLTRVMLVHNRTNTGFAAAANTGAAMATKDVLLFLNPDVLLDSDAIHNLCDALAKCPTSGAIGARLRYPDGSFQPTCRRLPTAANILFSRGSVLGRLTRRTVVYTLGDADTTTEVPAVAGTVLMIRRSVFEQTHGFDERFFMYMEDTDLCARLIQSGRVNLFVPEAGGVHHWGGGSTTGTLVRNWYHHRSVFNYFLKHHPNGFTIVLLPLLLSINLLAKTVLEVFHRRRQR
jgi:N-acetylglucosaminyl-diphospho-decaprenol L-rhamnosyltransferase